MNSTRETIRITLRSKRVPARMTELDLPSPTPNGIGVKVRKRVVVYEYVLDDEQKKVLEAARELANRSRTRLVVADLGREGILQRLLTGVLDRFPVSWSIDAPPTCSASSRKRRLPVDHRLGR